MGTALRTCPIGRKESLVREALLGITRDIGIILFPIDPSLHGLCTSPRRICCDMLRGVRNGDQTPCYSQKALARRVRWTAVTTEFAAPSGALRTHEPPALPAFSRLACALHEIWGPNWTFALIRRPRFKSRPGAHFAQSRGAPRSRAASVAGLGSTANGFTLRRSGLEVS
jgi:hypothetical protein